MPKTWRDAEHWREKLRAELDPDSLTDRQNRLGNFGWARFDSLGPVGEAPAWPLGEPYRLLDDPNDYDWI